MPISLLRAVALITACGITTTCTATIAGEHDELTRARQMTSATALVADKVETAPADLDRVSLVMTLMIAIALLLSLIHI